MAELSRRRVELADGKVTTVHVVAHDLTAVGVRVVRIAPEAPVDAWSAEHDIREAVSGGFSVKPDYEPLGELWTDGRPREHREARGHQNVDERTPAAISTRMTTAATRR